MAKSTSKAKKSSRLRVCLTGGGTAGHVTPHFALLPEMQRRGWEVFYIGSGAIEKELVTEKQIPFHQIAAGKLRRYLSVKNLIDVFKVAWGCMQALFVFLKHRPDVVFSKGGFVAVPVAVAAWCLRIPVVSHESDMTPGLANKIIKPFAKQLLVTFPETKNMLGDKAEWVGTPVRATLFQGRRSEGLSMCGFSEEDVPTILVMGGSQGSEKINKTLEKILPQLVEDYRIIHLSGRGKSISFNHPRYCAFEYVSSGLEHLLVLADFVISRAGANAIFEFLALRKPMLLIPLAGGSRGDQIVNARSFAAQNYALVLQEDQLNETSLSAAIRELFEKSSALRDAQAGFAGGDTVKKILSLLESSSVRS